MSLSMLRTFLLRAIAVIVSVAALTPGVSAQGDVQLSQYWAVPTFFNPAATGATDFVNIRGGARLQWLGIKNAPQTFLLLADAPFMVGKKRIGVGLTMNQESLGLFSNLLISAQGSYKLKIWKGLLSIGVQAGYNNTRFKGSEVYIPDGDDYHQSGDQAIPTQDLSGNAFDLSAGLTYTHPLLTVGISGLHLLQPTIKLQMEGSEASDTQQYETELTRTVYFTALSNIQIKNTLFELQPSLMLATDFGSFRAQASVIAKYNKFLWGGLGYSLNSGINIMLGAEFKNFFLGYAYEYPTSAIAKGSSGSHELLAGYRLKLDFSGKNKNKHRSIRIM